MPTLGASSHIDKKISAKQVLIRVNISSSRYTPCTQVVTTKLGQKGNIEKEEKGEKTTQGW